MTSFEKNQIFPEDAIETRFLNKELVKVLQDTGFLYSILAESLSSVETSTRHHTIKLMQLENETIFSNGELFLTYKKLSSVGVLIDDLMLLPDSLKHLELSTYCSFQLKNNLTLICFSKNQQLPESNIIRFLDFIVNLQYQKYQLKKNIKELEEKTDSLQLKLEKQQDLLPDTEDIEQQSQILLAEDNPANQMLIMQQLELLGYTVDVAKDGELAFQLWEKRNYSLLLTDCNMPVMDGFALTSAIREKEKHNGSHIPIVAVTANAMQGESEKCLSLGMDDYLSKPIKLKALKKVLERWLTPPQKTISAKQSLTQAKIISTSEASIIDFKVLNDLLGSDIKMQQKFLLSFAQTTPEIINQISKACGIRSAEQIDFNLHKLKSSAKAINAERLLETSLEIENSLSVSNWNEIERLSKQLKCNIEEIEVCIENFNQSSVEKLASSNPSTTENKFIIPKGFRVLLLDDDPFMLDYIKIMLTTLGVVEIDLVDQGEKALQVLKNKANSIDVVFCDLNMPGMDGVSFLRHLANLKYGGGIIINSGEDADILSVVSELATAHQLNLLGSLRKPLMPEQVLSLFKKMNQQKIKVISEQSLIKAPQFEFTVSDLEKGIEENHIIVYYQPKISIKTRQVIGFEALARWDDPARGIIPPNLFIPIAESENLICKLTEKVFSQTIAQTKIWCQESPDFSVSVNFSMQTLSRLDLPDNLIEILRQFKINANNIIIEVTESGLMKNLAVNMEVLARLKMLGFTLSIDDFGTGYSSMNQLQRLPFSELKLDYSFVHGAVNDPKARAILESSIHLARNLNLTIVAEGVESQQDWDLIKELGCDVVQGFFIAKPMPAEECSNWLKNWSVSEHPNL